MNIHHAAVVPLRYRRRVANFRLTDEKAAALRARVTAVDDDLVRAEDDELTDRLAERGAERFAELHRRLGE